MIKKSSNSRGITLVELIVAAATLIIFLVGISFTLTNGLKIWSHQSATVSLEDQLRAVEDRIIRDLRTSKTATSPNITRLEFQSFGQTQTSYYVLEGSVLKRSLNGGAADPIAQNMQAQFQVTALTQTSTPPLRVDVGLRASLGSVTKSATFSIVLRNR